MQSTLPYRLRLLLIRARKYGPFDRLASPFAHSQHHTTELTFIICARTNDDPIDSVTSPSLTMIGDVNLFLKGLSTDPEFEVEVEIMIAGESRFNATALYSNSDFSFRPFTSVPFLSSFPIYGLLIMIAYLPTTYPGLNSVWFVIF